MTFKNLSLALCSLFLISCGSEDGGPKAQSTKAEKRGKQALRAAGTTAAENVNIPGDRTWGRVYLNDTDTYSEFIQDQAKFQEQVYLLLEPQFAITRDYIVLGHDDSALPDNEKSETGIAFWGKGLTITGGLNPNRTDYPTQNNIFDPDTAALRLSVFRGLEDSNNAGVLVIEEIPIHFNDGIDINVDSGKLVDSYISGNEVQLIFADAFGKISLHGNFDSQNFTGKVYFLTDAIDQDDTGTPVPVTRDPQLLGKFSVSTCGFFTCAN